MKTSVLFASLSVATVLLTSSCASQTVPEDSGLSEETMAQQPEPTMAQQPELVVELFQPIAPNIENPITWDNLVERSDEISAIVYNDVYATIERNKKILGYNDISYEFYRSPNLKDLHYANVDSWLDDLFALYANTVKPDTETYIAFPFEDLEWAVELLSDPKVNQPDYEVVMRNANQGPEQGIRQNAVPGLVRGRWDGIWSLPATLGPEPGTPYTSFAIHEENAMNHEYAHQVQARQFKDEFLDGPFLGMERVPCFLVEGTARIPELTLIYDSAGDFANTRPGRSGSYLYDPESEDELGNFTITMALTDKVTVQYAEEYLERSFEPRCSAGYQYALGYSLGLIASEGLAAIGGVESTMALFTRMGQNDLSWEEAFSGIYGVSWDEARPILAELIAKEYRP